jgi:hypothetical protein
MGPTMGLCALPAQRSHISLANRLDFYRVIRVFVDFARRGNRAPEPVCIETTFLLRH